MNAKRIVAFIGLLLAGSCLLAPAEAVSVKRLSRSQPEIRKVGHNGGNLHAVLNSLLRAQEERQISWMLMQLPTSTPNVHPANAGELIIPE